MFWRKIFRRTLTALLIVAGLFTAAIVGAKIQMYTATGEDYANEIESQDIAKLRARDKAIKKATKQAGVYLKSYSRSVNSELTDDEIIAITSNSWQLVGEPKYSRTVKQISDETSIIVWTATVEVNVDDSELQNWIKRDAKEKSTIINQTREAQKSAEENERKIEDLREKYNRATSQAEKDNLRKQMTDADRDFLANQKLEEVTKLWYKTASIANENAIIKLCDEAIELNPNNALAYYNRGCIYSIFSLHVWEGEDYVKQQLKLAIDEYSKAIELNPNLAEAYDGRGNVYKHYRYLKQYERAIQDFNKAIELNPNQLNYYIHRGLAYMDGLKQYEQAIQDFSKAIQLKPNDYNLYKLRGECYQALGKEWDAQADFAKAKELGYKG
ncbi:MAG: tetratricopeptide repeat protein [Quinella sp. 3Q1]|nr:tetratricopeptide repeat protein [Quinella sp. 3Q1]